MAVKVWWPPLLWSKNVQCWFADSRTSLTPTILNELGPINPCHCFFVELLPWIRECRSLKIVSRIPEKSFWAHRVISPTTSFPFFFSLYCKCSAAWRPGDHGYSTLVLSLITRHFCWISKTWIRLGTTVSELLAVLMLLNNLNI